MLVCFLEGNKCNLLFPQRQFQKSIVFTNNYKTVVPNLFWYIPTLNEFDCQFTKNRLNIK